MNRLTLLYITVLLADFEGGESPRDVINTSIVVVGSVVAAGRCSPFASGGTPRRVAAHRASGVLIGCEIRLFVGPDAVIIVFFVGVRWARALGARVGNARRTGGFASGLEGARTLQARGQTSDTRSALRIVKRLMSAYTSGARRRRGHMGETSPVG